MKFKVYEEDPPKEEDEVTLRLTQDEDGTQVIACNSEGVILHCGALITFNDDGTITRNRSINRHLGFQLTGDGEIVED